MKKIGLVIFMTFLFLSCSVKKLVVIPTNSARGDAVFSLIVPNNNYAKLEDIHIYSWTQVGVLNVNRVLIDFNLDEIPKSARIESAYLSLYFNPTSAYNKVGGNKGNQGPDSIVIQRVTSDWNENDVTWNRQPETTKENQVIIGKLDSPIADYTDIDITNIIQDIVNSENGRYGILIRHKDEIPYNVVFFASSNHPDIKLHPNLRIYYRKK
jgi:hypothetical protein